MGTFGGQLQVATLDPGKVAQPRLRHLLQGGGASWLQGWCDCPPGCQGDCGQRYCGAARVRQLKRATRRPAAAARAIDSHEVFVVTTTRTERCRSVEDFLRFRAANQAFCLELRAAGAVGIWSVFEVKVHRDEEPTGTRCCGACELCEETDGMVPAGHLHAHNVAIWPEDLWVPLAALQALTVPRRLDSAWGTLDFSPDPGADRADASKAFGYVSGYLGRLKDGFAVAWFGAVAPGARLQEGSGIFRGHVQSVTEHTAYERVGARGVLHQVEEHVSVRYFNPVYKPVDADAVKVGVRRRAQQLRDLGLEASGLDELVKLDLFSVKAEMVQARVNETLKRLGVAK